jgi:tetratricopeptide (TPR) repeat protein
MQAVLHREISKGCIEMNEGLVKQKGKLRTLLEWGFLIILFGGLWFAAKYWTEHPELKGKLFPQPQETKNIPEKTKSTSSLISQLPTDTVLQKAISAFSQDDFETSVQLLHQQITQHPNDKEAYLYLARIYLTKGQTEDALNSFGTVLKLDPNSKEAIDSIARIQMDQVQKSIEAKDWRAAFELLEALKNTAPDKEEWSRLNEEVRPNIEWIQGSQVYVEVLKQYQQGNQYFLSGWALELPSYAASERFEEAVKYFEGAKSLLENWKLNLERSFYESMTRALGDRIESLTSSLELAQGMSQRVEEDWNEIQRRLIRANEYIEKAVSIFENAIESHQGILDPESEKELVDELAEVLKGILVVSPRNK